MLINCAGIAQRSLLVRTQHQDIAEIIDTNLQGTILGCKTVGQQMIANRSGGCIINVSSLLAQKATVGTSVYAASKAGVVGTFCFSTPFSSFIILLFAI